MLVLSRKPGQSIRIGDNIVVTVVERQGDQIKLGIVAPAHVDILRDNVTPNPLRKPPLRKRLGGAK